MPLYHFRCPDCNKDKEGIQSIDSPLPLCDVCGQEMKKVIETPSLVMFGKIPPSLRRMTFGTAPFTSDYSGKNK